MEKLLIKPKQQEQDLDELDYANSIKLADTRSHFSLAYDEDDSDISNSNPGPDLIKNYFLMKLKYGVDKFYQQMFKRLEVFPSLCEILRDDLESANNNLTIEHEKLIERIYFILAYSVTENIDNSRALKPNLKSIILPHFKKNQYIDGCSMLLFELVNNSELLMDEKDVIQLSNKILVKVDKLSTSNMNKTVLIATLARMIQYKGFLLEDNQNKIMTGLISKTRKNVLVNFKDAKVKEQIIQMMQKGAKTTKVNGFEIDVYSNRLLYITCLVNLMTTCIEDGNPFTENICNILLSLNIV